MAGYGSNYWLYRPGSYRDERWWYGGEYQYRDEFGPLGGYLTRGNFGPRSGLERASADRAHMRRGSARYGSSRYGPSPHVPYGRVFVEDPGYHAPHLRRRGRPSRRRHW